MSCLEELYGRFPVRNSPEEKAAFRTWAKEETEKSGYAAQEEVSEGHINLVIGDPKQAKVLFTAHYDTPRRALLPNILLPANKVLKMAYTFGTLLPMLALSVAAGVLAGQAAGGFEAIGGRLVGLLVYGALYFGLFFLLFRGPANQANKNDNTSGAAAVLDLAASFRGRPDVALILFDNEEKGKKGSKAWTNTYPAFKEGLLTINMDCVGYGEHYIVSVPDGARQDPAWPSIQSALEDIGAKILPVEKTSINSDQKNFVKGVGICACLYKGNIYYTPRIHTVRDTLASGETIDRLTAALAAGVEGKTFLS